MASNLIKSGDVQGKRLAGLDGAKLGAVREIFVDLATGAVAFIVVEGPSLLGGSGKFHPVPWSAVRYDGAADAFQIDMTKDAFKASPNYARDQLANPNFGWDDQATRYFSAAGPAGAPAIG